MISLPSLSDYGTHDDSEFPELWQGCVGAWAPCLGPSGLRLHDFSRGVNWGTLTNMDAATDWVVSGGQYALDFDGVNDRVECDRPPSFLGDCTWFCWFRHGSSTGSDQCLFTTRNILTGSSRNGITLFLRESGVGNDVNVASDVVFNGTRFRNQVFVATNDNTWRLVVGRRIGASFDLWVVGSGQNQIAVSTATITHEVGATFGLWRDYSQGAFSVQIDDVRIYNRALDIEEIRLLSRQRGIAYTPRRRRRRYAPEATGARRLRLLTGMV